MLRKGICLYKGIFVAKTFIQPLNTKITSSDISLQPNDNRRLMSLCGRFDEHLRQIEKRMGVEINNRGHNFQVLGEQQAVKISVQLIQELFEKTKSDEELSPHQVHLSLQACQKHLTTDKNQFTNKEHNRTEPSHHSENESDNYFCFKTKSGTLTPRSPNQKQYLQNIYKHDINFGIGPAGTGKTYLAVACAVQALKEDNVKRIILVRPAVEAGEKLGFLPGDLAQKIDPYLRPLYDALYEMLGPEHTVKLIEKNIIEIASLAYMRGRTLNDSFIILDESQNTTPEQMKMFLTRIGFGSTAVITGDITQVDLPRGHTSGLRHIIDVLKGTEGISFTLFNSTDVVRHPLVQKIIEAYHAFENKGAPKDKK